MGLVVVVMAMVMAVAVMGGSWWWRRWMGMVVDIVLVSFGTSNCACAA